MLASHNTMTYLPPRRWWARPIARWWRCQSRPVAEQYAAGVRHLDIRVRRDDAYHWRLCHGAVDLATTPQLSLSSLLAPIINAAPQATIRLVLERGDAATRQAFYGAILPPAVTERAIKTPWVHLYQDPRPAADHYYKPLDTARPWWRQLPALLRAIIATPRSYAATHPIPADHRGDTTIHYHDMI